MAIRKAERQKSILKMCLTGTSGSGKTLGALSIASGMATSSDKICLIDTENFSANIYADRFDFSVIDIAAPYSARKYIEAIVEAEREGMTICIIDSLSHAWAGSGGSLEQHERAAGKNTYMNWAGVTKDHNRLFEALLQTRMHTIVTMRSKTEYALEIDGGKAVPRKIGLKPIQREGTDYEFSVVLDIARDGHVATASKDRTGLFDTMHDVITIDSGRALRAWLDTGAVPAPRAPVNVPPPEAGHDDGDEII